MEGREFDAEGSALQAVVRRRQQGAVDDLLGLLANLQSQNSELRRQLDELNSKYNDAVNGLGKAGTALPAALTSELERFAAENPELVALVVAPYFRDAVTGAQEAWRRVVVAAAQAGIPAPAFSSSLAYYDGVRAPRLPANLIQAQRDFFGAHTYRRTDRGGTFHTEWSGDRTESPA